MKVSAEKRTAMRIAGHCRRCGTFDELSRDWVCIDGCPRKDRAETAMRVFWMVVIAAALAIGWLWS